MSTYAATLSQRGGRVNPRAVIVEGAVEVKSSIGMSGLKH